MRMNKRSVPPFFSTRPSDRNQIWHTYSGRHGTHSELKKNYPPHPRGVPWGGVGGFLGGQKIKSSGNVMNCPKINKKLLFKKKKTRWGVGWGGSFRGQKIKSPGNVMNCPENPQKIQNPVGGVGWGGSFRGQHFMNCRENR